MDVLFILLLIFLFLSNLWSIFHLRSNTIKFNFKWSLFHQTECQLFKISLRFLNLNFIHQNEEIKRFIINNNDLIIRYKWKTDYSRIGNHRLANQLAKVLHCSVEFGIWMLEIRLTWFQIIWNGKHCVGKIEWLDETLNSLNDILIDIFHSSNCGCNA